MEITERLTADDVFTHPLLAQGPEGQFYTAAEIDEIIRVVLVPADTDGRIILGGMMISATSHHRWNSAVARYAASQTPAPASVPSRGSDRGWCRHCDGPVADGGRGCGECG